MGFNRAILIGRLTRDPELKYTTNGKAVTTFTLAVDRDFTNQQGEREADFIPVVAWNKLAETIAHNLSKGRLIAIEGRIQVRTYDDKEGVKRYATEIIADKMQFLEKKQDSEQSYSKRDDGDDRPEVDFGDDDVPF
ncbi:MAG TPA: single-stranded DNA-binding protein [Clostridiales bacterium]|jgi:single-strand DNA-binding protein|nr:single-stranded DNA-binding protein [Clostridiales bacterium]